MCAVLIVWCANHLEHHRARRSCASNALAGFPNSVLSSVSPKKTLQLHCMCGCVSLAMHINLHLHRYVKSSSQATQPITHASTIARPKSNV